MRVGWGKDNPVFRQLFTAQFVPGASPEQISWAVVAGRSNTEIGAALFVSEKTVRNSLTRIFEKLGVHTRTQAAVMARDRGLALLPTE